MERRVVESLAAPARVQRWHGAGERQRQRQRQRERRSIGLMEGAKVGKKRGK